MSAAGQTMDSEEHPVMPACDDRTVGREQSLGVTMSCSGGPGSLAHWMTSYKFLNAVPDFDGISIDMHQPMAHSTGAPSVQKNQLDRVKIEARPQNMLTSWWPPLLKTVTRVRSGRSSPGCYHQQHAALLIPFRRAYALEVYAPTSLCAQCLDYERGL